MGAALVWNSQIIMKTIKVIDGKAYICKQVKANCNKEVVEFTPISYDACKLQNHVLKRMRKCMDALTWAEDHALILSITEIEGGQYIQYSSGEGFSTVSYEAMESLVKKLERFVEADASVSADWLEHNLELMEAVQLFKACIVNCHSWGLAEERLHAIVECIRNRTFGN